MESPLLCWRLFLPCYLAAHRGIGIGGTDTETYYNLYEQLEAGRMNGEYFVFGDLM